MPTFPAGAWSGADLPCSSFARPAPLHTIFPNEILGDEALPISLRGLRPSAGRCSRAPTLAASVASTRGEPARSIGAPAPGAALARRLARLARKLAAPLAARGPRWRRDGGDRRARSDRRRRAGAAGAYAAIGLPVNLRGLAIEDVRARVGEGGDKKMLMVEGAIVNLRQAETAAPELAHRLARRRRARALCLDDARAQGAGWRAASACAFAARLAAPPEGVEDALVKFVAPGDKVAPDPEGS